MVGVVGGKIPWIFPSQDTQLEAGNCKLSCVTDAETEIRYYCVCIVLEVRRCHCLFPVGCCRCLPLVAAHRAYAAAALARC